MACEIGIGARVWVGWAYDPNIPLHPEDPRLRYARVVDGPWLPGEPYTNTLGRLAVCHSWTKWRIEFATGWRCMAAEWILYPVDDGDEEVGVSDVIEAEEVA